MRKNFDLKILENADKKTVETLSERYKAVDDKEGEIIFQKSIRKYSSEDSFDTEAQVQGVDVYCRPKWHRAAQITAAISVLLLGISGAILTLHSLRGIQDGMTNVDESNEETTTVNNAPEQLSEQFDMSTQEGIYYKMLTSVDFFDKVSGSLVQSKNGISFNDVEFEIDLNSSVSYSHIRQCWISSSEEIIDGNLNDAEIIKDSYDTYDFINYSDGTDMHTYNNVSKKHEYLSASVKRADSEIIPYNELKSGNKWQFKNDPLNCPYADNSLFPQVIASSFLADYDAWKIDGEIEYLNRKAVSISSTDDSFTMLTDKETGVLLKFISYTGNGDIAQFISVLDIAFDDEAAEVRKVDFDESEGQ